MTEGSESSFGSGGGPPFPADPSEDEQAASEFHGSDAEGPTAGPPGRAGSLDPLLDDIEIPRHSMPFRKWSAAHGYGDSGPSMWERIGGWLGGLFGGKRPAPSSASDDWGDDLEQTDGETGTLGYKSGVPAPKPRDSFDDLDSAWSEPPSGHEPAPRRESGELPDPDDFEPAWDDPHVRHDTRTAPEATEVDEPVLAAPPIQQPAAAPSDSSPMSPRSPTATDPLWDEPRVAAPVNAPAEAIDRGDLDFVWAPPGPDDIDLLAESRAAEASAGAESETRRAPKRLSFISRLFSRKKVEKQPAVLSEFEAFLEEEQAAENKGGASVEDPLSARHPAVDDFAMGQPADQGAVSHAEARAAADAAAQAAGDFDVDVEVDVEGDADVGREVEAVAPPPRPKRPSIIARLFGRKLKETPSESELDDAIAELDVIEEKLDPMVDASTAEPEPVVDDRAPDGAIEEPTIQAARRPSLTHSAEDAAHLADFLAMPFAPPVAPETEPPVAGFEEPLVELSLIEPAEEPLEVPLDVSFEAPAEALLDVSFEAPAAAPLDASFEAPVEEPLEAALEGAPVEASFVEAEVQPLDESPTLEPQPEVVPALPPEPKKLGFFSQLLRRVSRSDFRVPKAALPPEEVPARAETVDALPELAVAPEVDAEPVAPPTDDFARWARPAASEVADTVEPPQEEATSASPIPFVDARDDFSETVEIAESTGESGRITEAFVQPIVDPFAEGDKTDEFEVVPGVRDDMAETAALAEAPAGLLRRLFGRKKVSTGEATVDGAAPVVVDTEGKAPFVLAKFRMFYNEVIRDKHQKSDVISGFATAIVSAAAADMADPEFASQLLSKRLSEMLELQAAESNWTGGDAVKYYPDAQYAMVALADETFLTIDWPGRPSWRKYMLEPKMFGSRGADTEFFRRVDKLLRDPDPPQGARDLARVYLLVIASGFRGLFREPGLKRPLAEYRRRLYEFSHLSDPLELYARDRKVFPEAAAQTLASRAVGRFTPAQKWIATVVILILMYATVSHVAWTRLSADLKDVMSRMESSVIQPGAR